MSSNEYSKYFFNFQDDRSISADNTIESLFEVLQMDLSFIKFISWAIPSIGFLGTVRGIGDALGKANEAVLGDITSMTSSLGVAFNSTFIALLISIFLMFIISRLELKQDELILKLRSKSF
jgi:biopolymer transport protein ExbB/TolQ